jgi:hypothetical protein
MNRGFRALYSLVLWLPICAASAEDFKLSDGTVLRKVRVVEVRPDSLTLLHGGGVAVADLAKLPKAIRARYGYDPRKAAAYREREAKVLEAKLAEDRRLVAAHGERQMNLARLRMEASEAAGTPGRSFEDAHFSYGSGVIAGSAVTARSYASGEARIGAEIERHEEARIAAARAPDTFWTADFWKHPVVQIIGGLLGAGGGSGSSEFLDTAPRNWR